MSGASLEGGAPLPDGELNAGEVPFVTILDDDVQALQGVDFAGPEGDRCARLIWNGGEARVYDVRIKGEWQAVFESTWQPRAQFARRVLSAVAARVSRSLYESIVGGAR
jgi:hypothetical protein